MLKTTLASLALVLAACSSPAVIRAPLEPTPAVAAAPKVAEVIPAPVPAASAASHLLSGKGWSITLPASFIQVPQEDGSLQAIDKPNKMSAFINIDELPPGVSNLVDLGILFAMSMSANGADVQSMQPTTWAGQDALTMEVAQKLPGVDVPMHITVWTTILNGRAYGLGCVAFPGADLTAAEKVCSEMAGTVQLVALPAPPAPVAPAVKPNGKKPAVK